MTADHIHIVTHLGITTIRDKAPKEFFGKVGFLGEASLLKITVNIGFSEKLCMF